MRRIYILSSFYLLLFSLILSLLCVNAIRAAKLYLDERKAMINRGLVALPLQDGQVFLTWRLLPQDPLDANFEIWRHEIGQSNDEPVYVSRTSSTTIIDRPPTLHPNLTYFVRTIDRSGTIISSGPAVLSPSGGVYSALVYNIEEKYKMMSVTTGDLDGDGDLEIIARYSNIAAVDPSPKVWRKSDGTIKIAAFQHTGEKIWSLDLGWGIEAGPAYSPLVVWDINSDGCSEIVLKTNEGDDPRNYDNDRLSILDGKTGSLLMQAAWPPADTLGGDYNSNSRNYIGIAHLDGINPSIIVTRGLYKTQVIWAYDSNLRLKWKKYVGLHLGSSHSLKDRILKYLRFDNTLERLWARYTGKYLPPDTYRGSHGLPISDIDLDGREEILWGSICIGQDGKTIWKITDQMPYIGHLDVVFPADIIPSIEGQEIFYAREGWLGEEGNIGVLIVNKFGETIWSKWGFTHFDGGWAAKILPNRADMQIFAYDVKSKEKSQEQGSHGFAWQGVTGYLWDSRGRHLSSPPVDWKSSTTFDWDGDGVKEIGLKKTGKILKFGKETVIQIAKGIHWGADIFGDHRDEVIVAPGDGKIYIYFNTDPLEVKPRVTKLIDRQYRNDLSRTMVNSINIPNESGIQIKN